MILLHHDKYSTFTIQKNIMQPTSPYSRHQLVRDTLEIAKQRMVSKVVAPTSNQSSAMIALNSPPSSSLEKINENIVEIIIGVGYVFIILIFLIQMLLRTIRKFEYYYMSPSYNRFGFIANEESDYDDSESDSNSDFSENNDDINDPESLYLSSSPISLRPTLSSGGKYLHLQTPVQRMNAVTPQTPLPVRRSLRLKIKSELNLAAMQNNTMMITRSQTKQLKKNQVITISSDPCPKISNYNSITTQFPHPEYDEEREYYVRYCNEKKMRKQRPEFNSPLFVRRLVL